MGIRTERIRTSNLLVEPGALSQLSYSPSRTVRGCSSQRKEHGAVEHKAVGARRLFLARTDADRVEAKERDTRMGTRTPTSGGPHVVPICAQLGSGCRDPLAIRDVSMEVGGI